MPIGPFPDFASCQAHMEGKYGAEGAKKVCGAMEARMTGKSDQGHEFNDLPKDAQMLWIDSFAESLQKNDDAASAQVAWANVYRRWEKSPNGQWVPFKIILNNVKFKNLQKQDRIIYGAASVAIKDTDGDLITEEALRDAFRSYITRGHVLFYHQNIPIGEVVPTYKTSDGKELTSGVRGKELDIVVRMYKDTQIANEVWNEIEAGRLRAFSIGGQVIGEPVKVCEDTDCKSSYNRVDKIDLHEISIVPDPANEASYFQIIKTKVEEIAKSSAESEPLRKLDALKNLINLEWNKTRNCPAFTEKALKIIDGDERTMNEVEVNKLKEELKKELLAELAKLPVKKQPGDCAAGEHWDAQLEDCVSTDIAAAKKEETPAPAPVVKATDLEALRAEVTNLSAAMGAVTAATKEIAGLKESILRSTPVESPVEKLNDMGTKVSFEPEKHAEYVSLQGEPITESFASRLDRITKEYSGTETKVASPKESEAPKTELESLRTDVLSMTTSLKATMDEIKSLKEKTEIAQVRAQVGELAGILKVYHNEVSGLKDSMGKVPAAAPKLINAPADKRTVALGDDVPQTFAEVINIQGASQGDFEKRYQKLQKEYGLTQ